MISSRENERWKAIRRLSGSKGKRRSEDRELALVEGLHLLDAALEAGLSPELVLATPDLITERPAAFDRLRRPPLAVAPSLLDELADADSPRGVVAAVRLPDRPLSALAELLRARRDDAGTVVLLADGVQDPANLGALARTAEAAGTLALVTTPGSASWRHPRCLRASTGSLLRIPVFSGIEVASLREELAPVDLEWVALVPRGGEDLYACRVDRAVLLAVGSEGKGLAPTTLALADRRVTIPLAPRVESLNAHVAAAVALFELRRRWREEGD